MNDQAGKHIETEAIRMAGTLIKYRRAENRFVRQAHIGIQMMDTGSVDN